MASSALIRRAISRDDLRSRSLEDWFDCSVLSWRRVVGLGFKLAFRDWRGVFILTAFRDAACSGSGGG